MTFDRDWSAIADGMFSKEVDQFWPLLSRHRTFMGKFLTESEQTQRVTTLLTVEHKTKITKGLECLPSTDPS
jgi:hypothetical protein